MSSIAIAKALREHARRLSLDHHSDGSVSAAQLSKASKNTSQEKKDHDDEDSSIKKSNTNNGVVPKCYKCNQSGHYAYDCSLSKESSPETKTTSIPTPIPTPTPIPVPIPVPVVTDVTDVTKHINLNDDLSLDSDNEPLNLYNDISRSASENDSDDNDSDHDDSDDNEAAQDTAANAHGKPLSELYLIHRSRMEKLKSKLLAENQTVGDDVWLLRYVLSFEQMKDAVAAASLSNEWRAKTDIADMIEKVKSGTYFKGELGQHVHKYLCCGTHGTMSTGGGPIFIVRAGLSRPSLLMDRLTKTDVSYYLLAQREHMFQRCDAETRRTQTLVKGTMIIDLANASLAEIWNESRFRDVNAAVSHLSGSLYPQMTYKTVIVNPPSYFDWLYSVVSKLVSTRLTKKIIVVPSNKIFAESKFATAHLNTLEIPSFLGGELQDLNICPELIGDLVDLEDEWYKEIVIGPMSKQSVRMTVPVAGTLLRHTTSLAAWDIKYTVTLHKGDVTVVEWEDSDGTPHLGTKFSPNGETEILINDVMIFSKNGALTDTTIVSDCGQLVIEFDNSFSFMTSKTVKYRFDSMGGNENESGNGGDGCYQKEESKK